MRELEDPEARYIIDSDGLGQALWTVLGRQPQDDRWTLYGRRGAERQALVDRLLVAIERDRFPFRREPGRAGCHEPGTHRRSPPGTR